MTVALMHSSIHPLSESHVFHVIIHRFKGVLVLQTFDPMGRTASYNGEFIGNFTTAGI